MIIWYYPTYNNGDGYFDTNSLMFTEILLGFHIENCQTPIFLNFDSGCLEISQWKFCSNNGKGFMRKNTFVSLFTVALSVCPSISLPFSFFLSLSLSFLLSLSFPLSTLLGFNHCCNWQVPAVHVHIHTQHTCALPSCCKSLWQSTVYVCVHVLWGQEREIWGDKDNERRRVSELQANSPTQQSVCCEALWGSRAVQPNCNYLREKRHGSRFVTEHNIVLELLENLVLFQLKRIKKSALSYWKFAT